MSPAKSLRVLVACEFSGIVRRAFEARGLAGRAFIFRNVPWQSGGEGPEVLEG